MMRPADHPEIPGGRIGVLLVNLGTPDAPTPQAVRRYLAEFLSDRRVVEIHPLAWQPILRGIILNTRPKKSAHAYSKVWSEAGSPLAVITAAQAHYWLGFIPAWNVFTQPLTFVMFLICIHAEANRAPFDLAEAEQELVGGYHTEYSSMRFALFFLAEYAGMITTSAVPSASRRPEKMIGSAAGMMT